MLETFRDRLQEVQQDISVVGTSLRRISLTSGDSALRMPAPSSRRGSRARSSVGDELLSHYQRQWEKLHTASNGNAQAAEQIAALIFEASKNLERQANALSTLDTLLANVLHAEDGIKIVENDLSITCALLERLERLIDERELAREVQQQHSQELDAKYRLALYKENRVVQFEKFKTNAEQNHKRNVSEFERMTESRLKERQETFDAAFKEDISEFIRRGGKVDKVDKPKADIDSQKQPSLEDIEVEPDQSDQEALAEFLTDA